MRFLFAKAVHSGQKCIQIQLVAARRQFGLQGPSLILYADDLFVFTSNLSSPTDRFSTFCYSRDTIKHARTVCMDFFFFFAFAKIRDE